MLVLLLPCSGVGGVGACRQLVLEAPARIERLMRDPYGNYVVQVGAGRGCWWVGAGAGGGVQVGAGGVRVSATQGL